MIKIRNKFESLEFIKDKNLNRLAEEVFYQNDVLALKNFLKKNDVEKYYFRELVASTPNVFYKLSKQQVLDKASKFKAFGVGVSSYNYIDDLVMIGEIKLSKNGKLIFSGSRNKKSSHRNFLKPNYFLSSDWLDRRLKFIPYINLIINYICKHDLFEMVIEYVVFDKPVGTNKENIVIYEIRTEY